MNILVLNGPNLNMLGVREPEIYGHETLNDIQKMSEEAVRRFGGVVDFRQSNHEGQLVEWIQSCAGLHSVFDGLIINAAAYTHTSVAIHDALKLLSIPIIEVHISDPAQRESFRHRSFIEPLAFAVIKGQGAQGYVAALERLALLLNDES